MSSIPFLRASLPSSSRSITAPPIRTWVVTPTSFKASVLPRNASSSPRWSSVIEIIRLPESVKLMMEGVLRTCCRFRMTPDATSHGLPGRKPTSSSMPDGSTTPASTLKVVNSLEIQLSDVRTILSLSLSCPSTSSAFFADGSNLKTSVSPEASSSLVSMRSVRISWTFTTGSAVLITNSSAPPPDSPFKVIDVASGALIVKVSASSVAAPVTSTTNSTAPAMVLVPRSATLATATASPREKTAASPTKLTLMGPVASPRNLTVSPDSTSPNCALCAIWV